VTDQLLYRLRRRPTHGEVRAEGVPEHVGADAPEPGPLAGEPKRGLDRGLGKRAPIRVAEHELAPKMPMRAQCRSKSCRERDLSISPALGCANDPVPRRASHGERSRHEIVTADHGEEFWEHGGAVHSRTWYAESTRVPLLARVPGATAQRIHSPVALVDLTPTLLELLGSDGAAASLDDQSLFVPAYEPAAVATDRPIFCTVCQVLSGRPSFYRRSVRRASWSLMEDVETGRIELYDRKLDPARGRISPDERSRCRASTSSGGLSPSPTRATSSASRKVCFESPHLQRKSSLFSANAPALTTSSPGSIPRATSVSGPFVTPSWTGTMRTV